MPVSLNLVFATMEPHETIGKSRKPLFTLNLIFVIGLMPFVLAGWIEQVLSLLIAFSRTISYLLGSRCHLLFNLSRTHISELYFLMLLLSNQSVLSGAHLFFVIPHDKVKGETHEPCGPFQRLSLEKQVSRSVSCFQVTV